MTPYRALFALFFVFTLIARAADITSGELSAAIEANRARVAEFEIIRKAAEELGLSRSAFYRRLERYGL